MRIRRRVLGSFLAVSLIVIVVLALVSVYAQRGALLEGLEADLANQALSQAVAINAHQADGSAALEDPQALDSFVRDIYAATGIHVTIISDDGSVLADSENDEATMANQKTRPEVATALAGGMGRDRRVSATLGEEMIYAAVPAGDGALPWKGGVVRVAVPASKIDPPLRHTLWLLALVGLAVLAPALLIGYLLYRSFTNPIEHLHTMAVQVAGGDLSYRVGVLRPDELGQLGAALNNMARELEARVASLAAEEERSAEILTAMTDGVLVLDPTGTVVRANAAATTIIGVAEGSLDGLPLLVTARAFPVAGATQRAREAGQAVADQIELPDGRQILVQAVPLHGGATRPTETQAERPKANAPVLLVFRDETARRRAEVVRRDFVANVSHDLKTPLAGLALLATTIRQVIEDDPHQAIRFAERLATEVGRLTDLVNDLLVLSQLEEPRQKPWEVGEVELQALARDVAEELEAQAVASERTLSVEPGEPVRISGNATQLATMLRNLIDNAVRYNHTGGHVWVSVEGREGEAVVTIRDDGFGIPRDEQGRIFERFYRVDKARSRDTGGTGLGLSIVKHVAESHQGRVELQSALGVGSSFTVTLPLGPAPEDGQAT